MCRYTVLLSRLMLLTSLFNVVCLCNACLFIYFLPLTFALSIEILLFSCFVFGLFSQFASFNYYFARCTVL